MNVEVELPDLGPEGGDEARVVEWHFEEGEFVEEGETLLEVASEAHTIEIPSPCAGTLVERIVEEDEVARIGDSLAIIDSRDDTEFLLHDES